MLDNRECVAQMEVCGAKCCRSNLNITGSMHVWLPLCTQCHARALLAPLHGASAQSSARIAGCSQRVNLYLKLHQLSNMSKVHCKGARVYQAECALCRFPSHPSENGVQALLRQARCLCL